MPKEEPEMIEANACSQCGFDLRLPPECTKERWGAMEDVVKAARKHVHVQAHRHGCDLCDALERLDGSG